MMGNFSWVWVCVGEGGGVGVCGGGGGWCGGGAPGHHKQSRPEAQSQKKVWTWKGIFSAQKSPFRAKKSTLQRKKVPFQRTRAVLLLEFRSWTF